MQTPPSASTPKPNQSQQDSVHRQRMTALVRAGVLPQNQVSTLKMALRKYQQIGDIRRLPKAQSDVLTTYLQHTSDAALGSQQAFAATKRNVTANFENAHKKDGEIILEVRYVPNLYQNPPLMLILKRTGYRMFPDGHRVAIYTNEKTGFVFTIPFDQSFNTNVGTKSPSAVVNPMREELIIDDEIFNELVEAIEDIELDQLDEVANVQKMGRVKLIRARIRGGKVQRRKKVSAVKGYTLRGGKLTRMTQLEKMHRKRAQRRAKVKRKAKLARALIKRKRSLRKRKALGLK